MSKRIRVAVVDDHPIFRTGVVQSLGRDPHLEVVAEGDSAAQAREISRDVQPDIMLLDVGMPGDGIVAAASIVREQPCVKVVMLTASSDEGHLMRSVQAGAKGYVLKGTGGLELATILRSVASGQTYLPSDLAAKLLTAARSQASGRPDPDRLSRREDEILDNVALGLTNKEIARQLSVSEKTVKHHMTNIMDKLRVRNRVEAALVARERASQSSTPAEAPRRSGTGDLAESCPDTDSIREVREQPSHGRD